MLFVGNHQKMGFYDTPLLVYELYVRGYRYGKRGCVGAQPYSAWCHSYPCCYCPELPRLAHACALLTNVLTHACTHTHTHTRRVRGLAHPGHWAGPFGKWFESFGAVKASPMAAFRLLRGREKVLLFPGGAK